MQFIEMDLPCALTDEELQSRARMLGETIWAIDDTKFAQTSAMKEFKERLVGLNETQRKLARVIKNRVENRMVRCAVEFHAPGEGMKRTIRMDTGEVICEETMTDSEKQLNLFAGQKEFVQFMERQTEGPDDPIAGSEDPPPADREEDAHRDGDDDEVLPE